MTKEDFTNQVNKACNEEDIDYLCIRWLQDCAMDLGNSGQVALKLLYQFKKEMWGVK